jgi:hypothetical protein
VLSRAAVRVVLLVTGSGTTRCSTRPRPRPPPPPTGDTVCAAPNVLNSTVIQCTAPAMPVGRYPVVVSLSGQNSSGSVVLDRLCGKDRFARPGERCGPCPRNADCVALFPAPLPRPGFYAVSLSDLQSCVPASACPGVDVDVVVTAYDRMLKEHPEALEALFQGFAALRTASNATAGPVGNGSSPVTWAWW